MEILVIALIIIVSLLLGSIVIGSVSLYFLLCTWSDRIQEQELIAKTYEDHLIKAAESNKALITKVVELHDKVQNHELIIKGGVNLRR